MAICITCGGYYKLSQYNPTDECDDCTSAILVPYLDEDDALEVESLLNPSGKIPARFNED